MEKWIRKTHRALSMTFTVIAIANIVALIMKAQVVWLGLLALVPLIPLLLSGLYLFALPYMNKSRAGKVNAVVAGEHS